jgi:hypothetical protein
VARLIEKQTREEGKAADANDAERKWRRQKID